MCFFLSDGHKQTSDTQGLILIQWITASYNFESFLFIILHLSKHHWHCFTTYIVTLLVEFMVADIIE